MQFGSKQSPPSFRFAALALPISPGRSKGEPNPVTNPETPMPLAFAPPLPPNPFDFPPATYPATAPVTLPPNDQHHPSSRFSPPSNPHVSAPLSALVTVERFLGFGWSSAGVLQCCSGVRKALPQSVLVNSARGFWRSSAGSPALALLALKAPSHSVLVKRAAPALVHCAPAFELRLGVERWPENGSAKRVLGLESAVTGLVQQARQIVLVESFSSPCNAPLPPFCEPLGGSALNGWGASHA